MMDKDKIATADKVLAQSDKAFRWQVLFFIFFTGSVIGWIYEEFFYYFAENWIGNRGFLFGPYLPVYGCGSVLIVLLLKGLKNKPLLVFLSAMVVTGVVEYFTGLVMWQIWQRRWWDYTGLFLNMGGYVCLRSVLTFGLGGLALIYVLEPMAVLITNSLTALRRKIVCLSLLGVMVTDLIITLLLRNPI